MAKRKIVVEPIKTVVLGVKLTFTEPMLGTAPSNPEIYADFIASKKFAAEKKLAKTDEEKAAIEVKEVELTKEELAMLPEEDKGITVFRRDPVTKALILTDHMCKGFLKEAGASLGDTEEKNWGITQKIDRWFFITDASGASKRIIPITRKGAPIMAPDGQLQRPLRAMTMQGPRVTLACSEQINAPAEVEFHIVLLPLALKEKGRITPELVAQWLSYGQYLGLGQWRTGGMGRFNAEVWIEE